MADQSIKDLQKKSLEILIMFDDFCKENNLQYFLCGGACIGTLRNGGFIPWDDDIDIFMLRKDYETLKKIWVNSEKYRLCRTEQNTFYRSLITAISDEETTFIKERQKDLDIPHGVRLEIVPLDYAPNNRFSRKIQILWALIFQIYNNQEPPTSKGKLLELVGKLMLWCFPIWKTRYRILKFAEKQMTKHCESSCTHLTELCSRYQYMVKEYPKEIFEKAVYKEFEGISVPLPKGYDTYLKMAFGDYMQLPPESEQAPKHDAVFIDLRNSYKNYKGKYYL